MASWSSSSALSAISRESERRIESRVAQRAGDAVEEVGPQQLAGRDVGRHAERATVGAVGLRRPQELAGLG